MTQGILESVLTQRHPGHEPDADRYRHPAPSIWCVVGTTGFVLESTRMNRSVLRSSWAPTAILPPASDRQGWADTGQGFGGRCEQCVRDAQCAREDKGCLLSDSKGSTARSELEHRLARSDSAELALGGVRVYVEVRPDRLDLAEVLA